MGKSYIFSSESVGEGHPDKVSDTISDAILDACLAQDKQSRVACETFVKSNVVCVGGEITTKAKFDYEQVIRKAIRGIGYINDDDVFHADKVFINNYLTAQSPDIAQGVDARIPEHPEFQTRLRHLWPSTENADSHPCATLRWPTSARRWRGDN